MRHNIQLIITDTDHSTVGSGLAVTVVSNLASSCSITSTFSGFFTNSAFSFFILILSLATQLSSPAGLTAVTRISPASSMTHSLTERLSTSLPFTSSHVIVTRSLGSIFSSPLNHVTSGRGLPFTAASNLAEAPSLMSLFVGFLVNTGGSIFSGV
ncbi:hypothetical protein NP493_191g02009 [Ridgeia piscesae]|uniref:Uncharacterized protein n=1 Tax=Ridgeia piscesae TaxID=27915 RepID=A0AAD9P1Y5_RIDPI|nr:hypothetical protein NP493_191g02009 [Ridgeia piscesae]